eukprot:scaffold20711_cov90-Phaeocystis_antarctica.AAC.2
MGKVWTICADARDSIAIHTWHSLYCRRRGVGSLWRPDARPRAARQPATDCLSETHMQRLLQQ